jgi:hypothetical protein
MFRIVNRAVASDSIVVKVDVWKLVVKLGTDPVVRGCSKWDEQEEAQ